MLLATAYNSSIDSNKQYILNIISGLFVKYLPWAIHSSAFRLFGQSMPKQLKSGYFRINYQTFLNLANTQKPDLVTGFLVLARFTNGTPPPRFAPHTITCAGANAMKTYAGLSEATGKGVIDALLEEGLITKITDEQKSAFQGTPFRPTYVLHQGEHDLDLPNSLVDGLKGTDAASALRRLKDAELCEDHRTSLRDLSKAEIWLDALMTLLAVYRHTSMTEFGGLNAGAAYRLWQTKSKRLKEEGYVEWMSEPDQDSEPDRAYSSFMRACLPHLLPATDPATALEPVHKHRFWNAWQNIRNKGLIYEAVTMFDKNPAHTPNVRLICTLRVNDFHADKGRNKTASWREGALTIDPSLLQDMKDKAARTLHFYTNPLEPYDAEGGGRQDTECLRLSWPDEEGHIVGIWRPRFRAISNDTGAWLDAEKAGIAQVAAQLLSI